MATTYLELTNEVLRELNEVVVTSANFDSAIGIQSFVKDALNRALLRLRERRNNLLKETDWTANSDVTMSDDMKTYRQALRDLTNGLDTVDKVNNVTWPTKP